MTYPLGTVMLGYPAMAAGPELPALDPPFFTRSVIHDDLPPTVTRLVCLGGGA